MAIHERQDVSRAMEAALKQATSGITGFSVGSVDAHTISTRVSIRVHMAGWSPTLTATDIRIDTAAAEERSGRRTTVEKIVEEAMERLRRPIERQRGRAEDAIRRGIGKPLPPGVLDQIETDVAFATVIGSIGKNPLDVLDGAMRRGHSRTNPDKRGGHALDVGGTHIAEYPMDDGRWIRVCLPHIKLRDATGKRTVTWRGHEIEVPSPPLPESVLATLIGRPIGDLVTTHPMLDARIIRKVEARTDKARGSLIVGIDLTTDPVNKVLAAASA